MDHTVQRECLSCLLVDLATGVSVRVSRETRIHLLDAIIRFLDLDPDADMTWVRDLENRGKTARTDEEWDVVVEHAAKAFRCTLPVGRPARQSHVFNQSV